MRRLIWLLCLFPGLAWGEVWVGPDCVMTWDPPVVGPVQGYRVYVSSGSPVNVAITDVGANTQTTCNQANAAQGDNEVYVTAYNPVGESGPSETVPFVLVVSAPGVPGGVSVTMPP